MTEMTAAPETLQPRYIQANGLEFAYLEARPVGEAGLSAPLVLCLHGFPDTAWSFADLLGRLAAEGYRAVALFMRGYAPSALPPDGNYSATELGRDVIALLEHFGVDKGYVVGHDWGAIAAYAAAGMRPDRIGSIVVAGLPHPRRMLLRPSRAQLKASNYMFGFQLPGTPERRMVRDDFAWLRELVNTWSPDWEVPDNYWTRITAALSEPPRRKAALAYYRRLPGAAFRGETWRYLMGTVRVPTRALCGERDGCMLPSSFEGQAHLFSAGYDLVELPGVGHFMHLEAPEAFAEQVLTGLRSASDGTGGEETNSTQG